MALSRLVLLVLGLAPVGGAESPELQAGAHSLSPEEQYLAPFLSQLLEYNASPIAKRYIMLSDLVDFDMNWFTDLTVTFEGSKFSVPFNKSIPLSIPLGSHHHIPLPAKLNIEKVTIKDLNEFKALRPLEFDEQSMFTWSGEVNMRKFTVELEGSFDLHLWSHYKMMDVTLTMEVIDPDISFSAIVAMDRAKLCEAWGPSVKSSAACAAYPVFHAAASNGTAAPVSGANVTKLQLNVSDVELGIEVRSRVLSWVASKALMHYFNKKKPALLKDLPTVSQFVRKEINDAAEKQLPELKPCFAGQDPPAGQNGLGAQLVGYHNLSQICVLNNGGYDVEWQYHVCPTGAETGPGAYPIDQMRCMSLDATDGKPTQPGDAIRLGVHAAAGLHEIADPLFRYQPNSATAGFVCSGTTFVGFGCQLASVVPVDPKSPTHARRICVMNQAGFVMWFAAKNLRTGSEADSGRYPINQMECVDMNSTATTKAGDEFQLDVHAIAGKQNKGDRNVVFDPDCDHDVVFICHGTTLDYGCSVIHGDRAGDYDTPPLAFQRTRFAEYII